MPTTTVAHSANVAAQAQHQYDVIPAPVDQQQQQFVSAREEEHCECSYLIATRAW
jgi:hypothetical protein